MLEYSYKRSAEKTAKIYSTFACKSQIQFQRSQTTPTHVTAGLSSSVSAARHWGCTRCEEIWYRTKDLLSPLSLHGFYFFSARTSKLLKCPHFFCKGEVMLAWIGVGCGGGELVSSPISSALYQTRADRTALTAQGTKNTWLLLSLPERPGPGDYSSTLWIGNGGRVRVHVSSRQNSFQVSVDNLPLHCTVCDTSTSMMSLALRTF